MTIRNRYISKGDVVSAGRGFVAECAHRYSITGTWWAVWSNGSTDLAKQVVIFINRNNTLSYVKVKIEEFVAFIADLPNDVAMTQGMTEWLQENVVGGWGYFSKRVEADGDGAQLKSHFLFKMDTDAVAFKLRFGDATHR